MVKHQHLSTNASLALIKQQLLLRHDPVKKLLTITQSDPSVALNRFEIYDSSGRLIASKTLEQATQSLTHNTKGLFPGVYIIKAQEKGIAKCEKITLN